MENDNITGPGMEELVLEQNVIYEINLESVIISWNKGAELLYGWKTAEAVGKPAYDLFKTEFHLKMYDFITDTVKNYIWTGALSQYKRDGSNVIVSSRAILHRDADGKPSGIIFVNSDITQLRKTTDALKRSEEMFSVTIHSIGDGVLATDLNGCITILNPVAQALTGWTQEEALGKHVDKIFNIINHDTRNAVVIPIMETLSHGTVNTLSNHTLLISKTGAELEIADSCAPIRSREGEVIGAVLVFRDVTGLMQQDAALENSRIELAATKIAEDAAREYAESLIDTIREPLIALDQNLRVISVSRSFYEFFKVKPEDTVGRLIYDLGNKQWDIPKLRELLEKILPEQTTFDNYEVEHDFSGVGRRIMLLNARQIRRVLGKESVILLAIEDITRRREIENGLEKTRNELESIRESEEEAREYAESLINTIREPLIALDHNLRIVTASRSFYEFFKVKAADTVGELIYDLGNGQWNIPALRDLLETILPQKTTFDNYEVEHDFAGIGRRTMHLNARQIKRALGKERIILLAIEDITSRREYEDGLEKTRRELEVIKKAGDAAREYAESLINTVREPLIALDQDLRIVTASRSFYEFFKVRPAQTIGQRIYDLGNKQWDIPKLRQLLETILPQETTFDNYEVEHDFDSIGRRIMLLNARQIQRVLGKERIILLAIEDITQRRNDEYILTKFNHTLRAISNTNMALMRAKNEQNYLDKVCRVILDDCGMKMAWVAFAAADSRKSLIPAASAGDDEGYLERLKNTWDSIENRNHPAERAISSGRIIKCRDLKSEPDFAPWLNEALKRSYASLIALPLKSGGKTFGALMIYSGVLESYPDAEVKLLEELAYDLSYGIMLIRMRNEKIAVELEVKKIAAFPKLNPNPISEIDSTGKLYYINPAFKKLFPEAAVNTLRHFWFEGVSAIFARLKGGKKKIIKRDIKVNEKYYLQTMVYMPAEETIRTYGVDITKRINADNEIKRLYAQMETKVEQRTTELLASRHLADIGTLAATVAHELRNPLGVINLASFNIRKNVKDKMVLKHLVNIDKKVAESGRIINNLLVYSRMKMPQFELENAHKLITESMEDVRENFPGKRIKLKGLISAVKKTKLWSDPLQFKEVLTNLITNAYQAMEGKTGTIIVKASLLSGRRISISVTDTGSGINKEDMGNIFKPFFTRKTKGTGLGLVICRDMIKMHDGVIEIASKPGKGSTFTVILPLRSAHA